MGPACRSHSGAHTLHAARPFEGEAVQLGSLPEGQRARVQQGPEDLRGVQKSPDAHGLGLKDRCGAGAVVRRRRTAGGPAGLGIRGEGDLGDQRAVCAHGGLGDGGGGEGFGHGRADPLPAVTDQQGQQHDRGRPQVVTRLTREAGADVPGGGIADEPRHQGVEVILAPESAQDMAPAPPDAVQVARGLPGIGEQCPVEPRPLLRRGGPQGIQTGQEPDGGQGVVPQVPDGTAEQIGEGSTHHGFGEFAEGPEREIAASRAHDEKRGPAPYGFIRVGESSERGLGGLGPRGPAPGGRQELHGLTTYERIAGLRELEQPDGHGPARSARTASRTAVLAGWAAVVACPADTASSSHFNGPGGGRPSAHGIRSCG